jgi:hypothetical protein
MIASNGDDLSEIGDNYLVDELELRGFVVISSDDYTNVINQIKEWRYEDGIL